MRMAFILGQVRKAGLIMSIALIPAIATGLLHPKRPQWTKPGSEYEVYFQQVGQWGNQVLWVDARPRSEFEHDHIPGAVLLNEDEWDRLLDGFLDHWQRNSRVVVYCSSVSCEASIQVAERLKREVRIENVYVLKGGWKAWQSR